MRTRPGSGVSTAATTLSLRGLADATRGPPTSFGPLGPRRRAGRRRRRPRGPATRRRGLARGSWAEPLLLRNPEDRGPLAELPPQLAPGVAAIVAAIEVAIPAGA